VSPDTDFDVVVVGCGGAGLSAAVSYLETAKAAGREPRIAVLERAPESERGGSTRWTGAAMRVDENFVVDPTWVGRVQEVSKGLADLEYCQTLEREVPTRTAPFLKEHGIEFMHFASESSANSMTLAWPNGGGLAIVDALAGVLEGDRGASIFYETEAVRLSIGEEGRVDGVVVRGPDGLLKTFHAGAVVLACGGFEGNYEMLTRYVGRNAVDLRVLAPGTQYNKGDGIRMATEIGAATAGQFDAIHSELIDIRSDRADAVLYGHPYTIAVNGDAKRFTDEGVKAFPDTFELIAYEVWDKQEQTAFLITDDLVMSDDALTKWFESDVPPVRANSIRELAVQLGLDPDALEATVEEFNAACDEDTPYDPFVLDGKGTSGIEPPKSNWASPLTHPPYYGYPVAAAICFTYGGLKTDTSARVLSTAGVPISGLYAAGELTGLFYHEYPSASSVMRSITFGHIAGEHAAVNSAVAVTR
jgi:tricarballylate dehydrogenase